MKVTFRTKSLEKACTNDSYAIKMYGEKVANKIFQRVAQMKAANSVEYLIENRIGRCHPLKGNMKNKYALDLGHPTRMIIVKCKVDDNQIKEVMVTDILDYH